MALHLSINKQLTPEARQALLIPPGMNAVHVGIPFGPTALNEVEKLNVTKVYIMANKSSSKLPLVEEFVKALDTKGFLAAPMNCNVSMGGAEDGLLQACNEAAAVNADCVLTIGGGAVQDAGKFVRLWLSVAADEDGETTTPTATVDGILAAASQKRDPTMPPLPPQICCPNSFAMAEFTHVAGLVTNDNVKKGATHPSMMPTVVIFDTTLARGLPDWVKFGTALRGVEHAIGAICHPNATDDIRVRALQGLEFVNRGLKGMVMVEKETTPSDSAFAAAAAAAEEAAQVDCYLGGWMAIRALNTGGCYPSIAHLIQNQYSARFNVHQGSCSGILCARILQYHREESMLNQKLISQVLVMDNNGNSSDNGEQQEEAAALSPTASQLVSDLVSALPGVAKDHADAKVDEEMLRDFAEYMYSQYGGKMNRLCPKSFDTAGDVYDMLALPIASLAG